MFRTKLSISVLAAAICIAACDGIAQTVSDGFDYPVKKPFVTEARDGDGYYVSLDFGSQNHLGEDWNGDGGGNTDLGDPVYAISNGSIVYAQNAGRGWGNVVVIEHVLPDGSRVRSMYAHLGRILWTSGNVMRGDQIGTIGRGYDYGGGKFDYLAHLHFELRTDISIGLGPGYKLDRTGWTDPSDYIDAHRPPLVPPPPPVTFMKALGTLGDDYASSIQQTSDGGFIIAGYTNGLGAGGQDVLLVKLDGSGAIQWAKTVGGTGSDVAFFARQTSDGGYIVTGQTDSVTGVSQILVAKLDGTGAFQLASTLGDSAAGFSVQQTTDGGYIVTGFPAGAIGGLGLLKYNATGQLQWVRRAEGTNFTGFSVQQTSDGGYIVAGNKQIGTTQYDATLLKFDGSGNLQWAQLAGGSAIDSGNSVQQTSDGGYIVAGATASFGAGGQDVLLLKYDASGTLQWARTAGGSGDDEADSVQQTSDGGYILSGRTASFGVGQNTLLLKYDGSGTLQWARAGGGSTSGSSVQQTTDGAYIVVGSTASFGAGGSDILLIRTDANGNIAGCSDWSSVSPSIGTTFPSAATSYGVDSPSFSVSAPSLTVAPAPLTPNNKCP